MMLPGGVAGAKLLGCAPAGAQISADSPIAAAWATGMFDARVMAISLLSLIVVTYRWILPEVWFSGASGGTSQLRGGSQFPQLLKDGLDVHFQCLGGHRRRFHDGGLGERIVPIGQD